ncbi:MAG: TldD/PmbA family protein [Candidatus Bathyarchaeota archaeon]|nr:TldD/PmbA family protein [Candidatus Bathyarchaeota archaeon]MCZ2845139.1 TldD/PmbA family protein [Candidatus Bathyarchaeota archaeon]
MMNHEELVDLVVEEAIRNGAEDVAALGSLQKTRMVRFYNNKISVIKAWRNSGISIMIGLKERKFVSSFNEISPEKLIGSVKELIKLGEKSKPNYDYVPLPKGPFNYIERDHKEDLAYLSGKDLVEYAEIAIERALKEGAKRVAGTLICNSEDIALKTSANVFVKDNTSSLETFVRAFVEKESSGQGISCSTTLKNFKPEIAGLEAAKIAKMTKNPKTFQSGRYNVIFGPCIFANLMNNVMEAASAFNVDAGLSFLNNEIGSNIASPNFTIVDDGTAKDGLNSRIFDDEGTPTKRTIVIGHGKLKNLLHNTSTAKKFKTYSTGNAGWISPSAWNIIIENGAYEENELFKELKNGLYITNNWYTRFQDYRNGDFSTVCRDGIFEIKNGEIITSVKNIRISDNFPRILKSIGAISNNRYWIRWWEVATPTLTPYALVKDIGITKSVF